MANINTYLNQILSATYGEEVRGAIHDSINAMNLESTEAISVASTAQDSAANSAENALTSKNAAANSASIASSAAENALSSKNAAEAAKSTAESSASTASSAAENALTSKNAAEAAKSTAESSASTASSAAENALESKNAAASSASIASTATEEAQNAEINTIQVAANVDALVAGVSTGGTTLMAGHAICQDLTDSNDDNLLDSSNNSLVGRVLFADAEDIISLKKNISDLEIIINQLLSMLIPNRLTSVETDVNKALAAIGVLNEHALLDSTL